MKTFKRALFGILATAAIGTTVLGAYGWKVWRDAQRIQDLDPSAALVLAQSSTLSLLHYSLVVATAQFKETGHLPDTVGLALGYSAEMFYEQEKKTSKRTSHSYARNCHQIGAPAIYSITVVKGAYPEREFFGILTYGETEEYRARLATEQSELTTFMSVDGGTTGTTVKSDANSGIRDRLSPKLGKRGGAAPGADSRACAELVEDKASPIFSQLKEALLAHKPLTLTDSAGKPHRFEYVGPKVTRPGGMASLDRLQITGTRAELAKLARDLTTQIAVTAPSWYDHNTFLAKTSLDETEMRLVGFRTNRDMSLTVAMQRPDGKGPTNTDYQLDFSYQPSMKLSD